MSVFLSKLYFDSLVLVLVVFEDPAYMVFSGLVVTDAEFPVGKMLADDAFNAGFQVFGAAVIRACDIGP